VSRLDRAEQHLSQVRATRKSGNRDENDDDSIERAEVESDRHLQALLLISSGPPVKCELSQEKLDFLTAFELTTNDKADGQ